MSLTSVGAIYATQSLLLQRIYIPHEDDSEIDRQYVHPGETLTRVPIVVYREGGPVAVQAAIGKPAHDGHCAIIHKDTGRCIGKIIADPDVCPYLDGHPVVLVDRIEVGDLWVKPSSPQQTQHGQPHQTGTTLTTQSKE